MKNYRIIEGYEDYVVYNDGTIFSLKSKINMSLQKDTNGRLMVKLCNGKDDTKLHSISRLVAKHFIPNPVNKPEVNHIDGNVENNRIENLEWVNPKENIQHKIHQLGKDHRGSKNGMAKLKLEQVEKVKELYNSGYKQKEIGKMFNISQGKISDIINGKSYKI
jgi:hypothetical protein